MNMNKFKSLLACILCATSFACTPTKALSPMSTMILKGTALVGGAFAINTLGYAAVDTLRHWETEKLKSLKYGLIGGIKIGGLIADILLFKAAINFRTNSITYSTIRRV